MCWGLRKSGIRFWIGREHLVWFQRSQNMATERILELWCSRQSPGDLGGFPGNPSVLEGIGEALVTGDIWIIWGLEQRDPSFMFADPCHAKAFRSGPTPVWVWNRRTLFCSLQSCFQFVVPICLPVYLILCVVCAQFLTSSYFKFCLSGPELFVLLSLYGTCMALGFCWGVSAAFRTGLVKVNLWKHVKNNLGYTKTYGYPKLNSLAFSNLNPSVQSFSPNRFYSDVQRALGALQISQLQRSLWLTAICKCFLTVYGCKMLETCLSCFRLCCALCRFVWTTFLKGHNRTPFRARHICTPWVETCCQPSLNFV